jgi:hypothetical protein
MGVFEHIFAEIAPTEIRVLSPEFSAQEHLINVHKQLAAFSALVLS